MIHVVASLLDFQQLANLIPSEQLVSTCEAEARRRWDACGGDIARLDVKQPWVAFFLHRNPEEWKKVYVMTGESVCPLTEEELPTEKLQQMRRILRDEDLRMLRPFDASIPLPEGPLLPDIDKWPYVSFFAERTDIPDPDAAWAYIRKRDAEDDSTSDLISLIDMADDKQALAYKLITRRWGREVWFDLIRSHWGELKQFENPKPPPIEFFTDEEALKLRRMVHIIDVAAGMWDPKCPSSMFFKFNDDRTRFMEDYGGWEIEEAVQKLGYSLSELSNVYDRYNAFTDSQIQLAEYRPEVAKYPWGCNLWMSKDWDNPEKVRWDMYFYTRAQFCEAIKHMKPPSDLKSISVNFLSSDRFHECYFARGELFEIPTRRPIPLAAAFSGKITVLMPDDPRYPWIRFLHAHKITQKQHSFRIRVPLGSAEYLRMIWAVPKVQELYEEDAAILVEDFVTFRHKLPESRGQEGELELLELLHDAKRARR